MSQIDEFVRGDLRRKLFLTTSNRDFLDELWIRNEIYANFIRELFEDFHGDWETVSYVITHCVLKMGVVEDLLSLVEWLGKNEERTPEFLEQVIKHPLMRRSVLFDFVLRPDIYEQLPQDRFGWSDYPLTRYLSWLCYERKATGMAIIEAVPAFQKFTTFYQQFALKRLVECNILSADAHEEAIVLLVHK